MLSASRHTEASTTGALSASGVSVVGLIAAVTAFSVLGGVALRAVAHASAPTLPATDPIAVARVRGEIGEEPYASLFEMLLTEAASGLAEMRSALAGGDARELGERAHRLRGGAAALGATAMAETARELQDVSRGGELAGAGELLDRLELELERARAELGS